MPAETTLMLPVSDGIRLDTTVVLPDGADRAPALVLVHGHGDDGNKSQPLARWGRFVDRGYAVIAYSVRGQGASEGLSFHLGARELFDLLEVLAWVRRALPVDPARVGVVGSSQGGWHAWMAAAFDADLAVAVPQNIFVDYPDFAVSNGCLSRWFFTRTMRRRVLSAGLQDLARRWAVEGEWDRLRAWLAPFSPQVHAARIRCPVLCIHGWHDQGMPADPVMRTVASLGSPHRLVVGGGGHDGRDAPDAVARRQAEEDRWVQGWLGDGGVETPPLGYTSWPGWDQVDADGREGAEALWYLHPGGSLDPSPPARAATHAHLAHRPAVRGYGLTEALDDDLTGAATAWPAGAVTWTGAALDAPLRVLGAPVARLFAHPDRDAWQAAVLLYDVAPDGTRTKVSWGHHGTRRGTPGRIEPVDVPLRAIAWTFAPGHRLALEVAANDPTSVFPWFHPYVLRIHHDPGLESHLRLPVLP